MTTNLIVAPTLFFVSILSSRLPRRVKRKSSNLTIENSPSLEIENLVDYAVKHKLFLDQSRKQFLERHHKLIDDLVNGRLQNRNRFRELLLGVKSVGKTELCKVLRSYMADMYKQVVTIYISYDASDALLSRSICGHIISQKNVSKSTFDTIISHDDALYRIEALEEFLETNNIRIFLLVDEFHFVYSKAKAIGEEIVKEMSVISGTSRGYIHCVVTGSSSCLRALAFAKLEPEEESNYTSYERKVDLNSTKLQPKWIFPIVRAKDFRQLLRIHNLEEDNVANRYFCSGGRPGLAIESVNIDDIPYTLSAKHLLSDNSPQATVLRGIFDCMESFNAGWSDDDDEKDEITILESDLTPIPETVLWKRIQELEKGVEINAQSFERILYRLADDGVVIFYQSHHTRMISISCSYIYFQLRQFRTSSLTWKEAVALKIPTGYFHTIAEDVAFRFIKQKSKSLFDVRLRRYDSTIFDFGTSTKPNIDCSIFTMESELADISYCIHKELVDGKDSCGADGILLQPLNACASSVRLLRFQLKLGGGKMNADDVTDIKNDMFTRGEAIVKKLSSKYKITEHICYLITTRHINMRTENEGSEYESSSGSDRERVFNVIGRKELADAKVWTEDVMCLGQPYSSNSKLDYKRLL